MKLPMDALEPRLIDVGVDLSRGDAGVAEQLLHLPQISPAGEKVSCETVPQRVRADVWISANPPDVAFDQLPNRFPP